MEIRTEMLRILVLAAASWAAAELGVASVAMGAEEPAPTTTATPPESPAEPPATPSPAPAPAAEPASFLRDVMPLFTKRGCNAIECHGSTLGKGGFRLSMFGAEPDADYDALTKMHLGRRINRVEPVKSLLLLKATNASPHTGGARIEAGSPEYAMLASWVAQGVPWGDDKLDKPVAVPWWRGATLRLTT